MKNMGLSRIEEILENILGETDQLPEPISRNEALLLAILNQENVSGNLTASYNNGTVTLKVR